MEEEEKEKKEVKVSENEKRKIFTKIINKSLLCSKATVEVAANIIDNIVYMDRTELIKLTERGLPDDLPELRSLIWKINLGYLPSDWNQWNRYLESKRIAYKKYRENIYKILEKELELLKDYDKMTKEEKNEMDKKTHKLILEQICKDTNRTHTEMNFFIKPVDNKTVFTEKEIIELTEKKRNCTLKNINDTYKINIVLTHADVLSRILFMYSKFEPNISYVQGMNELLAPIYYVFSFDRENDESIDDVEADSFWCFFNLMYILKDLFDKNKDKKQNGIKSKANKLKKMLKVVDKHLSEYLDKLKFDFSIFAFRWISLMFSQDFDMLDILRIWDYLLSNENKYENCYYFCLAIILMKKDNLIKNTIYGIYENLQNLKDLEIENIIFNANYIKNKCSKKCLEIMKMDD